MPHPDAPATAKRILAIISHTHWDREWYLPFHEYRLRLTEMVSSLLHLLETDPTYRCFHLDGHSAVIDDYLEMHPEDEDRVRAAMASGRLLIGPWYILPDEFLVDGESLVRNLLLGRAIARRYGEPMPVGYLPDQFGHVGQIPQILRGFGLDSAVIWRGVAEPVDRTEFWWESPDGSRVLAEYLRYSYSFAENLPDDPAALAERLAGIRETLEPLATTPYVYVPNGNDHAFPQRGLGRAIAAVNRDRLLGPDVEVVHGSLPHLLCAKREHIEQNGVPLRTVRSEFRSGKRTPLLPGVLSARIWIKQANTACEFLLEKWAEPFAAFDALERTASLADEFVPHTHDEVQRRHDWSRGALRQAWKYLLQNQPHDSICGCSIDQVHEEMRPRFAWVEQIGGRVRDRALEDLAARVDTTVFHHSGRERVRYLAVFNPSATARTDLATVHLRVPRGETFSVVDECGRPLPSQVIARHDREVFSTEVRREEMARIVGALPLEPRHAVESFAMWLLERAHAGEAGVGLTECALDAGPRRESARLELTVTAGQPHNHAAVAETLAVLRAMVADGLKELYHLRVERPDQEEVDLALVAQDIAGHGYRTVALVEHAGDGAAPATERLPFGTVGQTASATSRIENEFFIVEASPQDGTLTVTDKARGVCYPGLHGFEDRGDAGDEYNFSPPVNDRLVSAFADTPDIRLVEAGPVRWTLLIAGSLRLPEALAHDRRSRSVTTTDCPVRIRVSLTVGVQRVDIRTEIDNRAADHRLRVLFPTGIQADTAAAESHFGVVERPLALPEGGPDWTENPTGTYPHKTFVDVSDGVRGLAVANRGLPEYEVMSGADGAVVALTVLRCVGWLSRDDLATRRGYAGPALPTPGAQMIGSHTFEYAIVLHSGGWENVIAAAHDLNLPLRTVVTAEHVGTLPPAMGFVEVTPELVQVSAVKLPEAGAGLVTRLYNPTSTVIEARVRVRWPLTGVSLTDLEERPVVQLPVEDDGRTVRVEVRPSKIVTLRLTMATGSE